jgi:holo-[acyl-carrier protein] synthase
MSIVGVGIDIIETVRIKKIFLKYGHKFAKKILSEQELEKYTVNNNVSFLAKSFAVKEAAAKALGTGIYFGIFFNQLELYNNKLGKPRLRFLNNSYKRLQKIKCNTIHVSFSDQKSCACAIVILES